MADAGRPADFANLNPEFQKRLTGFEAALDKAGIGYSAISGYRTPEYQNQMYQNHLAKTAGQPLPYPNVEAPGVVAPPWRSFHNYGLATDFHLNNPADYTRMAAMAPQFGLSGIGASDPGHIQLAGTLADDIKQYNLAGWRPETRPAPAEGAVAFTGGPPASQPPQNMLNRGTGTTSPSAGNSFFGALHQIESGNKNIYSAVDKDYSGQPNSRSQGYDQIDTPTWLQFAAKAGIDTTKYPNAMSAPAEVQDQVAAQIPLSRFGARTQRMLGQQFGQLDPSKTMGELAQGTTLNSTPPGIVDPSIVARGGTSPAIPATSGAPATAAQPPQNVGDWLRKAITKPAPTKDAQGNVVQGKSPLEALAGDIPQQQKAEIAPLQQQAMMVQDPTAQLAGPASQLFSQVSAASAKPLSWSSTPYGSNAGQQQGPQMMQPRSVNAYPNPYMAGMTLNSSGGY